MKKLLYILLCVFSLTVIISCEDDAFLEEHPKDIFTPANAFTSSKQVDDQIITAYRAVADLYNNSGFGGEWVMGAGSDLYDVEDYVSGGGNNANSNYSRLNENSFNGPWNDLYQIASYANFALAGSELVEWTSDAEKAYEVAQAKFFVGWAYLRLGELFGGVPLVKEYSETLKLDYQRSTMDETYQWAIDNFIAAASGLPSTPVESGRLTKDVANHFLAEAYLAKGEYDKAITAATSVINNHPLMTERFGVRADPNDGGSSNGVPNYRADGNVFWDLFRKGNYDAPENTESIWIAKSSDYDTYQAYAAGRGSAAPLYGDYRDKAPVFRDLKWKPEYIEAGTSDCPWSGNVDLTLFPGGQGGIYLGGFSRARWAPTQYVKFGVWGGSEDSPMWNDMRNSEIVYSRIHLCINQDHSMYLQPVTEDMIVQRSNGIDQYFPITCKLFNREDLWGFEPVVVSTGGSQIYGRDMYLVRSAETYLIRAEAYLRNNEPQKAADDINTLRQRSQCEKLFSAGEVDIYTILDERVRELMYEEQRWYTLYRISGQVFKDQLMNHAMYVADADPPIFTGTITWDKAAIPLDAVITVNTDAVIEQNPGWE